jgi:hypothetical protein
MGPRRPRRPERSGEPHSAGHLQVLILAKVTVSLHLLGAETERDTHGGTPRRIANSVHNLRMSSPGGSSIEPSGSSYGIDMIALTEMSRKGSKIETILTTEWEIGPGRAGRVSKG